MFTVEVGTVLTIIYTIAKLVGYQSAAGIGYLLALDFWLVATLLFANFASAICGGPRQGPGRCLAEDAGRATPARRFRVDGTTEQAVLPNSARETGWKVVAGEVIPGDGEIIEGVASVDESAITGESAPVIREAGGDVRALPGARGCSRIESSSRSLPTPAVPFSTA